MSQVHTITKYVCVYERARKEEQQEEYKSIGLSARAGIAKDAISHSKATQAPFVQQPLIDAIRKYSAIA